MTQHGKIIALLLGVMTSWAFLAGTPSIIMANTSHEDIKETIWAGLEVRGKCEKKRLTQSPTSLVRTQK